MNTRLRTLLGVLAAVLTAPSASASAAADWKPIDPAHLALTAPKIQKDADSEALLWEIRVADEFALSALEATTVFEHYLRIKIFTDRGRDAHATVDIPYVSGMEVRDVAARTIRADGSIVELKKSDVYKRTIVKADELRVHALSFAVPAIEKGAIIEYRWREVYHDSLANYLRLPFSREIPVHLVQYYIRPVSIPGLDLAMSAMPFNGTFSAPQQTKDGFTMVSLADVAANRDEAFAPPPFEHRPWMFLFYAPQRRTKGADYWTEVSSSLHEYYSRRTKPNDDIRRLAASAIAGATTDAERAAALVRAMRGKVTRVDVDTADPKRRARARENHNAGDVLKRGVATGDDMVTLFVALATAAGMEARVAASPNRAEQFHKQAHQNAYFVRGRLAAIKSGDGWLLVDPANEQSDSGALRWYYEWQEVLLADPKQVVPARTPLSPPDRSVKRRTGTFRLAEDGTLEGECRIEYTGHWAATLREQEDQDTPAERENSLRDVTVKRLPGAELTDIRIEHLEDLQRPYANSYKIRIPGYAQRTGSRLFFQPAVFQKGVDALFPSTTRAADVYFPFPWSEVDKLTIEMPAGFVLEQPERPAGIEAGAGRYAMDIGVKGSLLTVSRTLVFGMKEAILFRQAVYPSLKMFFDRLQANDGHTLVLRRKEN